MSKISDETGKFLLKYSYLFWEPLFIETQTAHVDKEVVAVVLL